MDVPAEEGTEAKKEILIHGRGVMRDTTTFQRLQQTYSTLMKMERSGSGLEMLENWIVTDS